VTESGERGVGLMVPGFSGAQISLLLILICGFFLTLEKKYERHVK
jgi:hypothetical protein